MPLASLPTQISGPQPRLAPHRHRRHPQRSGSGTAATMHVQPPGLRYRRRDAVAHEQQSGAAPSGGADADSSGRDVLDSYVASDSGKPMMPTTCSTPSRHRATTIRVRRSRIRRAAARGELRRRSHQSSRAWHSRARDQTRSGRSRSSGSLWRPNSWTRFAYHCSAMEIRARAALAGTPGRPCCRRPAVGST